MKGGSSALRRCLMDVAALVAWSCADSLPFTFVGPCLVACMYRQNQELLQCGEEGWHPDDMLGVDSHASLAAALLSFGMRQKAGLSLPLYEEQFF